MTYAVLEHERPIVIGHRGAAGTHPENTLASFAQALEDGADMLESDLHLSRDGAVVMIHDPDVSRTTNGAGAVSRMKLREVFALDAGYRFTPDGGKTFPYRDQGISVPTLAQAFNAFAGAKFHLDLKDENPRLVVKTLDLIESAGRADDVILTSFSDKTVQHLREDIEIRGLDIPVAASAKEIKRFLVRQKLRLPPPQGLQVLSPPDRTEGRLRIPVVTAAFNRYAHKHGLKVYVWTVNEEKDMRRVLSRGADGIFTDFPGRAARVLGR